MRSIDVAFGPSDCLQLSQSQHPEWFLAGVNVQGRGQQVQLGYTPSEPRQEPVPPWNLNTIPIETAAITITTSPVTQVFGDATESAVALHWMQIIRRSDLRATPSRRQRDLAHNPWCRELPPFEVDRIEFGFHYNGTPVLAPGIKYEESWAFGTTLLLNGFPAEVIVAGRGLDGANIYLESATPSALRTIVDKPRLVLE